MNEFHDVPSEEMNRVVGGNALVALADGLTRAVTGLNKLIEKGVDLITAPPTVFPPSGWPHLKVY